DASGQVLFASSPEWTPLVGDLPDAETIQFFQAKRDDRIISGVTLRKDMPTGAIWVQVGEDLAHRDVLLDDVVANFF
ncbi:hypothetical protein ABTK28_22490, partial [Acinetobacter baumannii]